jgi:hypothetical protein
VKLLDTIYNMNNKNLIDRKKVIVNEIWQWIILNFKAIQRL